MRHPRHMNIVRSKIEKEPLNFVVLDEARRFPRQDIRHIFIDPTRGLTTAHITDATDAIDDRLVMSVARVQPKQLRMILSRRLVEQWLAKADADRIVRIDSNDALILDIDARYAIASRRHEEGIIEADFAGARFCLSVPVDLALSEPEMPLADNARRVARTFQNGWQSRASGLDDEIGVDGQDSGAFLSKRVLAREHRKT